MGLKEKIKTSLKKSEYFLHETKKNVLTRFFLVVLIVVLYFVFVSLKYGIQQGFLVTILTWSAFVFCTPIADAGFLLDFPMRLITGLRMIYSEMIVWSVAILLNLGSLFLYPQIYAKTFLLRLLKTILLNPIPYWAIILLSLLGTFLSVYFGDELIDVVKHKQRKKYKKHKSKYFLILFLFIFVLIILVYFFLLKQMGISFPF